MRYLGDSYTKTLSVVHLNFVLYCIWQTYDSRPGCIQAHKVAQLPLCLSPSCFPAEAALTSRGSSPLNWALSFSTLAATAGVQEGRTDGRGGKVGPSCGLPVEHPSTFPRAGGAQGEPSISIQMDLSCARASISPSVRWAESRCPAHSWVLHLPAHPSPLCSNLDTGPYPQGAKILVQREYE